MKNNYSDENIKRRRVNNDNREKTKKVSKKKKGKRVFKRIFLTVIALIIICMLIGVGLIFGIMRGTEKLTKEDLIYQNLTTFIYDKNGNEYYAVHGEQNRIIASLTDMSPYLPKAFIAIEDERFEKHFGIDIKRTGKAVLEYVFNKGNSSFGGSTITQQLVKNITGDKASSGVEGAMRKLREWVRAVEVETWLTKDEIMELYLNIIYLGDGAYGAQAASYTYFGKDVKELTLAECAILAGITHGPESYDYNKNPQRIKERQEVVLAKMYELEMITQEEYNQAVAQEIIYNRAVVTSSTPYIVEAVIDQVIEDLQEEKDISKELASKMVYSDGLKIYTNIDPDIQASIEKVYEDETFFPLDKSYNERPQSAMVIMDYKTGAVVGLVGGAGDKVERGLNRATQSARQPGSTIKPVAVYGPGINEKAFTAATVYDDVPTTIGGISFKNSGGGFGGLTTVRKGLEKSNNIVAIKSMQDLGVNTSYKYLEKMGITTLDERDKGLATALGGVTNGIIPLEMCGAYATIGNKGVFIEPMLYNKIVDKNGQTVIQKQAKTERVFTEQAAYITLDMMRDVVRGANGTAGYINIGGNPVAAKTGSTDDYKDRWFCAITPYYVGAVWYGFDNPKTIHASGQNPAAKIWNAVMKDIHSGLEIKSFEKPGDIVTATICIDSGKLATELCSQDPRGSRTKSEMFLKGTVPSGSCETHVSTLVCSESNELICEFCPIESQVSKVFIQRAVDDGSSESAKDNEYSVPKTICSIHTNMVLPPVEDPGNIDNPTGEPTEEPENTDKPNNNEEENNTNTSNEGYVTE
ncbi:MAG: PBP1A family penicillin-binding protein [Clostridiales bacterium]|nr:PBP1A family penicillin-binding protein [Clostridiales bacterium]